MDTFCQEIIRLFREIHSLDRVPRAGFLLRGVPNPESVSAHCHFLSLLVLLVLDEFPGRWDREKALTMAIIHDLSEAKMMDIPMPISQTHLSGQKSQAEQEVFEKMFVGFSRRLAEIHKEFIEASSDEAKLVRGLDKVQMMLKVMNYDRERQGDLEEFWNNPNNFCDYGIDVVRKIFEAICSAVNRPCPRG